VIHEAAVFLMADRAAVSVFSRISDPQWATRLPAVFDMPGADQPTSLRAAINHYAYDNAWVPDILAGRTMHEVGLRRFDGDLLGADPAAALQRISAAAIGAAQRVTEPAMTVHCSYGDCPVDNYLWQLNIARTLSAHDVAGAIGVDDALSEELAQQMFNGTAPTAYLWESFGVYRKPVPVGAGATWREKYLGLTGRSTG
jgi:hypothetical protein